MDADRARELKALGHDVWLMPASYVKAYVKRSKNDAADAAAICEAVTRPSMRSVPIKTAEQKAAADRRAVVDCARRVRMAQPVHRGPGLPSDRPIGT